jgi:hypothetical protein
MRLGKLVTLDWSDDVTREYLREHAELPEDFDLPYDEVYVAQSVNAIVAGELAHLRWRMQQIDENYKARTLAGANIIETAERVLGEPWELSSP